MEIQASSAVCSESRRIRALVVSDVRLYRDGLWSALGRRETIDVVGTAASLSEAVASAGTLAPTVIIVDMAIRDSVAGVRALAAAMPAAKIVAFAVDELLSDIPLYAEAGIAGYVPCEATVEDLADTIESVSRDEVPCSPRVAAALFRRIAALAGSGRVTLDTPALSRREQEVLALVESGFSNKEIAEHLTIAVATVKNHIHSVLRKLHVATRAEAATRARGPAVRSRVARI